VQSNYRQVTRCGDCKGVVAPAARDGRYFSYTADVIVLLPSNVLVPRCQGCGTDWLTEHDEARIGAILEEEYQKHAELIQGLRQGFEARKSIK